MSSLDTIYENMGLNKDNGLHKKGEKLPNFPSRIRISLELIDYDAIFSFEEKPLIIFKELPVSEDTDKQIENLHKSVWNLSETPILIILVGMEIRFYNGFVFDKEKNHVWKTILSNDLSQIKEFSYIDIKSGEIWKRYHKEFDGKKRAHAYLLKNLRVARKKLAKEGLDYPFIHNLLGRLIFSRFLIDREKIIKKENFQKIYGNDFEDLIKNKSQLYSYFHYLKEKFNGDLFPVSPEEINQVNDNHLDILYKLFKGYEIETGQSVLFDVYDFSIIPIEVISSIYETFLDKTEKQSEGVYYTPLSLVDYVLKNTLDKKLESSTNCKILDPSCGSGVFLVESLRKIIEKHLENRILSFEDLKNIVLHNIFGVDIDQDAINISIFSIYLTLLDYTDEKNFKFPKLLNNNLFCSDFFNLNSKFNNELPKMDLIVGNPPWFSKKEKGTYHDYCKNKEIPIGNKQIAEAFLARTIDFVTLNTQIALLVTSKILYNVRDESFRKYFLKNFLVQKILNLSPIKNTLFNKSGWPGAIFFYKIPANQNTEENIIEHISVKTNSFYRLLKLIIIDKHDVNYVKQSEFLEFDWLWKTILVGNSLDFYCIKKLNEEKLTILNYVKNHNTLIKGGGANINADGKDKPTPELFGAPYINIKNKRLKRYNMDYSEKWPYKTAKRYNKSLFEPPLILTNSSVNPEFRYISAFSNKKVAFKQNVLSIKGTSNDVIVLKNLMAIINSKLHTYYSFLTGTLGTDKIYRDPAEDKLRFPLKESLVKDQVLFNKVEELEDQIQKNSNNVKFLEDQIDKYIYDAYDLTDTEIDLIDYALKISIPLIKEQTRPFEQPSKNDLKKYAEIFYNQFEFSFEPEYFSVEIYTTEYFVAMNFKVVSQKPNENIIFKNNKNISEIVEKLGVYSIEKIGDIYVQRDIKEFTKSSFSIIKPREFKNWHNAAAWTDIGEFLEIMFRDYAKGEK